MCINRYRLMRNQLYNRGATTITLFQSTDGLFEMKLRDDEPIFTKQKVDFLPLNKILRLVVSSVTQL